MHMDYGVDVLMDGIVEQSSKRVSPAQRIAVIIRLE